MARPFRHRKHRSKTHGNRVIRRINGLGKFERESVLTLFAYDTVQNGMGETVGDDNGGESYTRVNGLWSAADAWSFYEDYEGFGFLNRAERQVIIKSVGFIMFESNNGFVEVEWYDTPESLDKAWDRISAVYDTDDEEPDEPAEEDWVTEDYETFYEYGMSKNRFEVPDGKDWRAVVKDRMDKDGFWPNVWWVSDHGNPHLLSLDDSADS